MTKPLATSAHALERALSAFVGRRYSEWHGLPAGSTMAAARRLLGLAPSFDGTGTLGALSAPAQFQSLSGSPVVLWGRDDALVLVEDAGPFDPPVTALDSPESRLPVHVGTASLPTGEWIYAQRGLALVVSSEGHVLRAAGFAPMPDRGYATALRRDYETRPLPRPRAGARP